MNQESLLETTISSTISESKESRSTFPSEVVLPSYQEDFEYDFDMATVTGNAKLVKARIGPQSLLRDGADYLDNDYLFVNLDNPITLQEFTDDLEFHLPEYMCGRRVRSKKTRMWKDNKAVMMIEGPEYPLLYVSRMDPHETVSFDDNARYSNFLIALAHVGKTDLLESYAKKVNEEGITLLGLRQKGSDNAA